MEQQDRGSIDYQAVIDELRNSPLALKDVIAPGQENDPALLEAIGQELFECDTCGWWCEYDQEGETEGRCQECER
jgi:hypothetical protein